MSKPRVLLLWPGTEGPAAGNFGVPQLVAMATYVRRETGANIDIVDLACERAFGELSWPRILAGPDGDGYDIVAFGCYASFDYLKCHALAEITRTLHPEAVLVAGGYHVSARPTDIVYDGSPFDVAIVGEGEKPLTKVVESVAGGAPIRNQVLGPEPIADLSVLPPTDWSLLSKYRGIARQVASQTQVYLSRGCPFDCSFCMERAKREVSWRPLPVERAIEEIELLDAYLGLEDFTLYFADALFGMRKAWRRELLEALCRSKARARKIWLLIRVDMVDEEDLRLFGRANCGLGFGLESGDPEMLRIIRKAGRLDDYLEHMMHVADRCREHDVPWGANVIVGHPGETEASMRKSATYLRRLFCSEEGTTGFLSVDPFRLYPGSPIDDERALYEQTYGTRFHRPRWWHDGDQEFLSEWIDPSAELTYRRRVALTDELFAPLLAEMPEHHAYRGQAPDYFQRAIDEQIEQLQPRTQLHYADRYYAWNRYLGRGGPAREEELARDEHLARVAREARRPAVERAMGVAQLSEPLARGEAHAEAMREALVSTPRERFVPLDELHASTRDVAVPLDASGQATVSALHAYARMFTLARVAPGMRVLDLGAGSGYGSALLARLVGVSGEIVAIELDPDLAAWARRNLRQMSQVRVVTGDAVLTPGAEGRFDAIVVGFAVDALPDVWRSWLAPGGRLVAPLSEDAEQRLVVARDVGGAFELEQHEPVRFVAVRHRIVAAASPSSPAPERRDREEYVLPVVR